MSLLILGVPRCPCCIRGIHPCRLRLGTCAVTPLVCAAVLRCSGCSRRKSNGRGTALGSQMPWSSCRRRMSHRFRPDKAARAHSTKLSRRIRHDCLTDAALVSVAPAPHEGVIQECGHFVRPSGVAVQQVRHSHASFESGFTVRLIQLIALYISFLIQLKLCFLCNTRCGTASRACLTSKISFGLK